jgi:hypothetical protein
LKSSREIYTYIHTLMYTLKITIDPKKHVNPIGLDHVVVVVVVDLDLINCGTEPRVGITP